MPGDLIDQVFGTAPDEPAVEYYPGSRRKLASGLPSSEFIAEAWQENYIVKRVGGEDVKMYTISAIAAALGVSIQTIRYWTRQGYLPTEPYRLPKNMIIDGRKVPGRRLYTAPMIEAAVKSFEKRGLLDQPRVEWRKHPDLTIEITEEWSRIFNQSKYNQGEN